MRQHVVFIAGYACFALSIAVGAWLIAELLLA